MVGSVRRIASAARQLAVGEKNMAWVAGLLNPAVPCGSYQFTPQLIVVAMAYEPNAGVLSDPHKILPEVILE